MRSPGENAHPRGPESWATLALTKDGSQKKVKDMRNWQKQHIVGGARYAVMEEVLADHLK